MTIMSKEELRNRLLGTCQLVGSVIRFEEGDFETSLVMNLRVFFNLYRKTSP